MSQLSLSAYREKFLNFEEKLNLFDLKIDNTYIWDYIRYQTNLALLKELNIVKYSHIFDKNTTFDILTTISRQISNSILKNPLINAKQSDILLITHPRRKMLDDNYYWDIYTDYFESDIEFSHCSIEYSNHGSHFYPPKNQNLFYFDFLELITSIKKQFITIKLSQEELEEIKKLEKEINIEFNVIIDLKERIISILKEKKRYQYGFSLLLNKIKPEIVIEVVGYSLPNMVLNELCKEKKIPTIEIQHGIISKFHFPYDQPNLNRESTVSPDYLFTFGDYWNKNAQFPIPESNIFSVGYPHFEKSLTHSNKNKNVILFISQETIGKKLSKLAVELSKKIKTHKFKIVYKFHPNETHNWKKEYSWLAEEDNIEVIDNKDVSLYDLFPQSVVQIGVYSTALYEGLGFSLPTFIYTIDGYQYTEDLLEKNFAFEVKNCDDILKALENIDTFIKPDKDLIFKSHGKRNILNQIEVIFKEKTTS